MIKHTFGGAMHVEQELVRASLYPMDRYVECSHFRDIRSRAGAGAPGWHYTSNQWAASPILAVLRNRRLDLPLQGE